MKRVCPRFYVPTDSAWNSGLSGRSKQEAAYLLNLIRWRWVNWCADDDGFVRLKAEYLRRVVRQSHLQELRDRLAAIHVIEIDPSHVPGEKSMGYRIREPFRRTHAVECADSAVTRQIWKLQDEKERQLLPVHRWLRERLSAFSFDLQHAESIIDGMFPDDDSPLTVDDYRRLLYDQAATLSEALKNSEPHLSCDRFGRVHTGISRLAKSLRCCLSVGGQSLVEIDLRNSQPLFAGLLAMRFHQSRDQKQSLQRWEPQGRGPYRRKGMSHPPPITMVISSQPVGATDTCGFCLQRLSDRDEYIRVCEGGELYESLMCPGDDRDRVKRQLFRDVLFGRDKKRSALRDRFQRRFPSVAEMLICLKRRDYQRPAWLMQREESTMFIGRICRRLMEDRPTMPLATIHDSVLSTDEHIDFVRQVALEEFGRLGVRPAFKTKKLLY